VALAKQAISKNKQIELDFLPAVGTAVLPSISRVPRTKKSAMPNSSLDYILNRVFEADCDIPDKSVDMILCDLPYGMTQNAWDSYIPLDKLWKQYVRIIKPNGVIALTSHGVFTAKLILSQEKLFKYKWVWEKSKPTNFLNAKKQPLRKHEDVCIFYRSQPTYNPQMTQGEAYDKGVRKDQLSGSYGDFKPVHVRSSGERYPTDILYCRTAESEGEVVHPTQKPISLGRYLIRTYTNEGDVVLDNTCGSGSFLVAALLEGRNFIGIEKNENTTLFKRENIDYIEVTKRRLYDAWRQLVQRDLSTALAKSLLMEQFREGIYATY
jgi:site-specific DNA-methyltransferase (adenine-specific)/modification methylase